MRDKNEPLDRWERDQIDEHISTFNGKVDILNSLFLKMQMYINGILERVSKLENNEKRKTNVYFIETDTKIDKLDSWVDALLDRVETLESKLDEDKDKDKVIPLIVGGYQPDGHDKIDRNNPPGAE